MKFAVFITTHGRADRVETYETLRKCGYTGRIFIVVDNEDVDLSKYLIRYHDVLVFNKQLQFNQTDKVIATDIKASVTYARNAVEHYAEHFQLHAFAEFDDDITNLRYRWVEGDSVKSLPVRKNLDEVLQNYAQFMIDNDIAVSSFVHSTFFMSGVHGLDTKVSEQRDACQIFIRNCKYSFKWSGVMRQDIITNLLTSKQGTIWWALPFIDYDATPMNETGENKGGMIDAYNNLSEYRRSMIGVITNPSSLKVGCANNRIKISWNKKVSYPMIISGRYKK